MSTALLGKVEEKRNPGRPPTSFISNIRNVFGLRLAELIHCNREIDTWRNLVQSCGASTVDHGDGEG